MPRFYLPPDAWTADAPALTGDEARHLSQVLRSRAGETITVFDGRGRRAEAEILGVARERVALRLGETFAPQIVRPTITLAQAIPKGKNMDLIVQKAVELGVSAIQPLVTRNTIVQPGDGKSEKWRRNALEACKQCGQDTLPVISDAQPYDRWLATQAAPGALKLIASLAGGAQPLKKTLRINSEATDVVILVGPEGDFTPQESAMALDIGFLPVTLGEIILRVETATLFCLSAVRYEFS
jgi:16S rRNA (uracil1498-N3)-methyltransferase